MRVLIYYFCTRKSTRMVLKVVKAVWFISLLVVTAVLLFVYAGLPEAVNLGNGIQTQRSVFFYGVLALLGMLNALAFVTRNLFRLQAAVQTWYFGMLTFLHLFLVVALVFFNQTNGLERFDYSRMGFLINGSLALLLVWAAGYPVFRFAQKKMVVKTDDQAID